MAKNLTEAEFWWLVGILEGEGYFGYEKYSQRVQVKMTDLDTMQKVKTIFEKVTGRVHSIHESPNKNPADALPYVIAIHGEDAKAIMYMVVAHMSNRRRQRIWQSLNKFKPKNEKLNIGQIIQFHMANK